MELVRVSKDNLGDWRGSSRPGVLGRAGEVPADGGIAEVMAEPGGGPRWSAHRPIRSHLEALSGVVALSEVSSPSRAVLSRALRRNGRARARSGRSWPACTSRTRAGILLDGAPVRFASPRDARAAGIAIVHQEPTFCRNLSVAENLCLAALPAAVRSSIAWTPQARASHPRFGGALARRGPAGRATSRRASASSCRSRPPRARARASSSSTSPPAASGARGASSSRSGAGRARG